MDKRASHRAWATLCAFSLVFIWQGCTRSTELGPAAEDASAATLSAVKQGVAATVEADSWTGDPRIEAYLTPLRVELENNSEHPLRLRYDHFALIAQEDGSRYSALPPYAVEEEVDGDPVAVHPGPISEPGFRHRGFHVAPYYADVYPGIHYWSHSFAYDPYYYDYYADYWVENEMPSEEMLQKVLPEGVIDPGGSVSGFLFFEHVPPSVEKVQFHYELTNAENGQRFGVISFPLLVEEK